MEKKIEVEVNGRKVRIMEHMLKDAKLFGARTITVVKRETPKELLKPVEKPADPLPKMEVVKEEVVVGKVEEIVPKTRKTPVRSKSKK